VSEWIKLYAASFTHPKTRRLAKRLGIPAAAAVGHLSCLWSFTAEFAPDGDLSRFDVEEIELGAGWEGDDGAFLKAAVKAGFIDNDPVDNFAVHDWSDYGGKLVAARAAERERSAARRASAGRPTDDRSTTGGRPLADRKIDRKRGEHARGREADAAAPPARTDYCACGAQLVCDGDGTDRVHCPVCNPVQDVPPARVRPANATAKATGTAAKTARAPVTTAQLKAGVANSGETKALADCLPAVGD
jgi:hypothetical protein